MKISRRNALKGTAGALALGVRAFVTGDTLELSYPAADFGSPEHERTELRFFVRAWAATDPSISAEILA